MSGQKPYSPLFAVKDKALPQPSVKATEVPQMEEPNSVEQFNLEEMSSPMFLNSQSVAFFNVKREVTEEPNAPAIVNAENLNYGPVEVTESDGLEHDVYYINEKNLSFEMFLGISHVRPPYSLQPPTNIVRKLPRVTVPVVIRCESRSWNLFYNGNAKAPAFNCATWKDFVCGNNLNVGDVCVFEVIHQSDTIIKFKVIILRGDLPPDLAAKRDADLAAKRDADLAARRDARGTISNPIKLY